MAMAEKLQTKDLDHLKRGEKHSPHEVLFSGDMILLLSQVEFLFHFSNKANFVSLVSEKLEPRSCRELYTTVDADHDITATDVNESLWKDFTIIGENTNVLILMFFYNRDPSSFKLIYRNEKEVTKNGKVTIFTCIGRN